MNNFIGGFDSPTKTRQLKLELLQRALSSQVQISKEALALLLKAEHPTKKLDQLILKTKQNKEFVILPKHLQTEAPKTLAQKNDLVEIVANYVSTPPVGGIKEMAGYFSSRLAQFRKYLQPRLSNLQSITNIQKANNEKISVIGIVYDKRKTKNKNIILELEDLSGVGKIIISRNELLGQADEILYDEVIGVAGTASKGVLFAEEVTAPDLPVKREPKHTTETVYAAFLSDIHIGSKRFLQENFKSMLAFISGKSGNSVFLESQQELIDNLKYIFIAGDVVDGIGIYPGQEKELSILDIYKQYEETARLFAKIPESIQIIACPGNHDYVRLAQPQPPVDRETAPDLYELPNLTFISSPGIVKIKPFEGDPGLKVLLYHGTSIDTIVPNVSSLKDGYKHPEKVMLSLLKKRHLSPQYASGNVPSFNASDPMTIPEDIDIIHTGHVHANGILNYRGVTLINSGTWQGITDFQKFLGHEPTPCRVPVLNLKNRQTKLLSFE